MIRRTSILWNVSTDELQRVVNNANSVADVLRHFNLDPLSGNHRTFNKRVREDNIDLTLLNENRKRFWVENSSRAHGKVIPFLDRLTKNSEINTSDAKRKLLKLGKIENRCSECGRPPEWNGKPLSLQLDHRNGIRTDNRIENLRLLCPNCHSQTNTFSGKNVGKNRDFIV